MMRFSFHVPTFMVALAAPILLFAQREITDIKLTDLAVPVSPGFVLADKAPSSVERPADPRAFAVSMLNLWQGASIEVTPYWFGKNENLEYESWIRKKFVPLETFNLSVASFKTDSASSLSGGFRTQIFRAYSKSQIQKLEDVAEEIRDALIPIDTTRLKQLRQKLDQLELRPGFSLELAGAMLGNSPGNSFIGLSNHRSGVWCNMHVAPTNIALQFTGLLRYSWFTSNAIKQAADSTMLDYGLALHYESGNMLFAAELVQRKDLELKRNFWRAAANLNYRINDHVSVVAAFGRNFGEFDNIIATVGVKFGTMEVISLR